jgi:hypothetical protein
LTQKDIKDKTIGEQMSQAQEKTMYTLDQISDSTRDAVPPLLLRGINDYVHYGYETGGFLRACLENNLTEAVGRADPESLKALGPIVIYLFNAVPFKIRGSKEKVKAHLEAAIVWRAEN